MNFRKFDFGLAVLFLNAGFLVVANNELIAQEETHEKLKPLSFLIGEYESMSIVPADAPEFGVKKGDEVKTIHSGRWILNGTAIEVNNESFANGTLINATKDISAWNPGSKQLEYFTFGTVAVGKGVWKQDGKNWNLHWKNETKGKPWSGVSVHAPVSDDVYTWQMVQMKHGDEVLPDWPVVEFKRVKSVQENWIDYLEGNWEFTFEDGRVGKLTYSRLPGNLAVTFHGETKDFQISGLVGWNPVEEKFFETDVTTEPDQSQSIQRVYHDVSLDKLVGENVFHSTLIGKGSQKLYYERIDENRMKLVGIESDANATNWTVQFQRVKDSK